MAQDRLPIAEGSESRGMSHISESKDVAFPFMKLPRELRNMVYQELWKDTDVLSIQSKTPGIGIQVHYNKPLALPSPKHWHFRSFEKLHLPTWLLTSKMFLSEGHEQLLSNSTWHVVRGTKGLGFDVIRPNPLLSLSIARYVTVAPLLVLTGELNDDGWLHILADLLGYDNSIKILRVVLNTKSRLSDPGAVSQLEGFKKLLNRCKKTLEFLHFGVQWETEVSPESKNNQQVYDDCRNVIDSVFSLSPDDCRETILTDDAQTRLGPFPKLRLQMLTFDIKKWRYSR